MRLLRFNYLLVLLFSISCNESNLQVKSVLKHRNNIDYYYKIINQDTVGVFINEIFTHEKNIFIPINVKWIYINSMYSNTLSYLLENKNLSEVETLIYKYCGSDICITRKLPSDTISVRLGNLKTLFLAGDYSNVIFLCNLKNIRRVYVRRNDFLSIDIKNNFVSKFPIEILQVNAKYENINTGNFDSSVVCDAESLYHMY